MCEICICINPLTSEEKNEYERIITEYKDNEEIRDYIWRNLTTGENIRFLHYMVIMYDKMKELNNVLNEL